MNKQIKFKSVSILLLLLMNFPLISNATCENSTIVNNSNEDWTVVFHNDPSIEYNDNVYGNGNVWFKNGGSDCANAKNGPCTLHPGDSVNLDYTTSHGGQSGGDVNLISHNSNGELISNFSLSYSNYKSRHLAHCPDFAFESGSAKESYTTDDSGDITFGAN